MGLREALRGLGRSLRGRGRDPQLRERGAAAVEFGLLLPLLMLLVMGIVEYGLVFSRQHVLTNAAREGARAASVNLSQSLAISQAQSVAANYLNVAGITNATVTASLATTVSASDSVQVNIEMPWSRLTLVPAPSQIRSRAVMRLPPGAGPP